AGKLSLSAQYGRFGRTARTSGQLNGYVPLFQVDGSKPASDGIEQKPLHFCDDFGSQILVIQIGAKRRQLAGNTVHSVSPRDDAARVQALFIYPSARSLLSL